MSAQEERTEIIRESLPELIKELTQFQDDDENTKRCEQFAWSIIRNHRNLSTNSHEIRRKIEGIQEKFRVDNFAEYAQHLGRLCDEVIQHPLCQEHYEVDVQWSLLDLLLTLAYNPTGALRRNQHVIDLSLPVADAPGVTADNDIEYWKNILKVDRFPAVDLANSQSDLSDWSDDSTEPPTVPTSASSIQQNEAPTKSSSAYEKQHNIKPPEKEQPFRLFNGDNSEKHLLSSVQNSWWQPSINATQVPIESDRMEANFAVIYSRFLSETSNNLIRFEPPSTATELSLIREILWMFHSPQKCKFFNVNSATGVINVRDNVSIPSVTVNGLASFLEHNFVPYIQMMHTLRSFLDGIYSCEDFTPSNTFECYAANMRLLLQPIWNELLAYEKRLVVERDFEINTIMNLQQTLKSSMHTLESIHEVHQMAVLNLRQNPAHISSAFLLASLMQYNRDASNATEANLAMSLFLSSVRTFCMIMDTWWTEGRLDDWQSEFLVECNPDQSITVRQYHKDKEKAFFVPTHVSKRITEDSLFNLLLEHSLEAGCTLNLLYEINRIGDLRNASGAMEGKLYNVFIEEVLAYVRTLRSQLIPEDTLTSPAVEAVDKTDDSGCFASDQVDVACETQPELSPSPVSQSKQILQSLTTTDEFLLLAFTGHEPEPADECDADCGAVEANALSIFEELQQSQVILPLEEVVLTTLSRILKTRIASANSFVMQLYREEFDILKHLRNIRKVLLMEASDLMHQFYDKLFKQVESGTAWANPFLLSMQLDDIVCSRFSDMSSLFRLDIKSAFRCQTEKVFEAVDELIVTYNFSRELSHIISENDIQEYNKVFRFLLKVKWGMSTLENLKFPRCHKRRIPYAPFEMIDLLMRRLEQLRFWMIYALQSIHSHLMTHVLQAMGEQLDAKIAKCQNLKEMETIHKSYIKTVCEHCFLVESFSAIKLGVEQLLNLAFILRLEWQCCTKYIESNSDPLAVDVEDSSSEDADSDYLANSQIDAIELTYIRCHQYLANKLNNEVYLKHRTFLSGLSAAFNTSLPH